MEAMRAIEVTGMIDGDQLRFDSPLPMKKPRRARAIILFVDDDDMDDQIWLYAAAHNPAFDFLKEVAEDIYTVADGQPFEPQQ